MPEPRQRADAGEMVAVEEALDAVHQHLGPIRSDPVANIITLGDSRQPVIQLSG